MIIRKKHVIVGTILFIFSCFIFYVNYSWGNSIEHSFILSAMTFLLIFLSFAMVWELRDFWQFRWFRVNTDFVNITPIILPIKEHYVSKKNIDQGHEKYLMGDLIQPNKEKLPYMKKQKPLIIFNHGFSDSAKITRYITVPIAINGFDIISYDCRGTDRSKHAGKTSEFIEIVKDLGEILNYLDNQEEFQNRDKILIGFSMGAISAMFQGLKRDAVKKIISVACMANYKDTLPKSPIPFRGKWWLWLRYRLKGVPTNPVPEKNLFLSPYLQMKKMREQYDESKIEEWKRFCNQKLILIHSKNDKIIPISHFEKNKQVSCIDKQNWMTTFTGGHNFLKYETILVGRIISELIKND